MPLEANTRVERNMGLPTVRDSSEPDGISKLRDLLDSVPVLSGSDYKRLSTAMLMIELDSLTRRRLDGGIFVLPRFPAPAGFLLCLQQAVVHVAARPGELEVVEFAATRLA